MTDSYTFPPFDLKRLLKTVFSPSQGEKIAILIDLDDPRRAEDFSFLADERCSVQKLAVEHFYSPLKEGTLGELGLSGGDLYAFRQTGRSNLDLPDTGYSSDGNEVHLAENVYDKYDIILCISSWSATAPLTALAKIHGFRGATLHNLNEVILGSGLCVDYNEVSAEAEKLRTGMTRADAIEIDFAISANGPREATLRLELGRQEAQKSHGLCPKAPDVVNLPAGEIFYVPVGADGAFPFRFSDGTLALLKVEDCAVISAELLRGDQGLVNEYLERIQEDPAVGLIGELGFGTQRLPVSGEDIQDEKILGTIHVATGRSDHLGGNITPDRFKKSENASHDDILFSPWGTPEVKISEVRMYRAAEVTVLQRDFAPAQYMEDLLSS